MEEEVVIVPQECEQLVPDEQKAAVDRVLVDLVGREETLVLYLSKFLVELGFGGLR